MARRKHTPGGIAQATCITLGFVAMVTGAAVLAVEYRPYSVPTDSMQPTIQPQSVVLAHPVKPDAVGRGDVVIFNDTQWEKGTHIVKRVIGVGGDTVACCDTQGRITVNGKPITEPYLADNRGTGQGRTAFTAKVPAGRLFLLGDNRLDSLDSRVHLDLADGSVPAASVIARVDGTAWPLSDASALTRTDAFDALSGKDAEQSGPLAAATWAAVGGGALVLLTAALGTFGGLVRTLRKRASKS